MSTHRNEDSQVSATDQLRHEMVNTSRDLFRALQAARSPYDKPTVTSTFFEGPGVESRNVSAL